MPLLSVIICTHNPRQDYLSRVLSALEQQTLGKHCWELLLIDNCSAEPISGRVDLSWHEKGRHVSESKLGLTATRLRGIAESTGDIIVFVDDDNVLAPDYLESVIRLANEHPHIGAFGASISGEFEIPPPKCVIRYISWLAIYELRRDYWSNLYSWSEAVPLGAGLCIRRNVAEDYARKAHANSLRRRLGRSGTGLGAWEDVDLAWCSIDLGMGTGRFSCLKITHLIPKERLQVQYLINLQAQTAGSRLILDSLRSETYTSKVSRLTATLRFAWRLAIGSHVDRKITFASRREEGRARTILRHYRQQCIPETDQSICGSTAPR